MQIIFIRSYLRKNSSIMRNYVFPKTVPSINPYIINSNRHINVLPTIIGPIRHENIKMIQLGLIQSAKENYKIVNKKSNCQCEEVYIYI